MVKVIRHETKIDKIYTYFEFDKYNNWSDFDILFFILTKKMECTVLEILDGIYSRHSTLEVDNLSFKLMYHEDFGNCLCSSKEESENYYNRLEMIANKVSGLLSN